MAIIKSQP